MNKRIRKKLAKKTMELKVLESYMSMPSVYAVHQTFDYWYKGRRIIRAKRIGFFASTKEEAWKLNQNRRICWCKHICRCSR